VRGDDIELERFQQQLTGGNGLLRFGFSDKKCRSGQSLFPQNV
jgi:hypothetical protein